MTHLSLNIRGDAEEQGPIERKLNHVVPVLRRDGALGERMGDEVQGPRVTGPKTCDPSDWSHLSKGALLASKIV